MYLPVTLFINYASPLPWWLGPVLQVLGLACLWATRYTARFEPAWGARYYLLSSVVRPAGIILVGWAWLEICSVSFRGALEPGPAFVVIGALGALVAAGYMFLSPVLIYFAFGLGIVFVVAVVPKSFIGIMPMADPTILLSVMMLGFIVSAWSVFHLGLRRSFLFAKKEDPMVADGPYRFNRHPQLLFAALMIITSIFVFDPALAERLDTITFRLANFGVFFLGLIVVTRAEESDLKQRFGEDYEEYCENVPGLFGMRSSSQLPSMKLAIGVGALSFVLAFMFVIVFPSPWTGKVSGNRMIYSGVNPRKINGWTAIVLWDMKRVEREIENDFKNNGILSKELKPEAVQAWREDNRAIKYSAYPQTLFYCRDAYYSMVEAPASGAGVSFPVVRKLPFELVCDDNHVEFAQAMDYDGDGFPMVWLFSYDPSDEDTGWLPDKLVAADDETNSLSPNLEDWLQERRKKKAPPEARPVDHQ